MAEALAWAAQLIEFGGALIVAAGVVRAVLALFAGQGIDRARLLVIAGVIGALGFKTAATLLKALQLGSWRAIGAFAAIFTLRTVIKRLFLWERSRLAAPDLQESQSRMHATMLRGPATISN